MGRGLCARVRETVESLGTLGELVLAPGRDVHLRSRQMALSVSSRRQVRQDSGLSASAGSQHASAQAFFGKALSTNSPRWPRKINLDGNSASHRALRLLRRENHKWKYVLVRSCRYLNNIVEQDHRA